MAARRPAGWQQQRLAQIIERRQHLREAHPDCKCAYCIEYADIEERLAAQRARDLAQHGEPPF